MRAALECLGKWTPTYPFRVDRTSLIAYAAATNDNNPWHVSGRLAPPVYAAVPAREAFVAVLRLILGSDVAGSLAGVHGEQDIILSRPIVPGMTLHTRAMPLGIHVKPSGTSIVAKTESRDEAGELVNEQYWVSYYRGVWASESAGSEPADHTLSDADKGVVPLICLRQHIDRDQTLRYADASRDYAAFHVDHQAAVAAGLPGVIVHGLCTLAFVSVGVIAELCRKDPTRLRRLACRFARVLTPGSDIVTQFWQLPSGLSSIKYGFEMTNEDGDKVLKNGLVEAHD